MQHIPDGVGLRARQSATRRTPRIAGPGGEGTELRLRLELKLIADVGLLGFPNAGKSTFVRTVSAARPKVAEYPFTTLVPSLGVVRVGDGSSFVVADIPGLIEGAAEGVGLGHQFLRHVERCSAYVHLVAAWDPEGSPSERYAALMGELERYDASLLDRPQIVALSKCDTVDPDALAEARAELEAAVGQPVVEISSVTREGLRPLLHHLWGIVQRDRAARAEDDALRADDGEE